MRWAEKRRPDTALPNRAESGCDSFNYAAVAESEDAPDLESGGGPLTKISPVRVQTPPAAFTFYLTPIREPKH